MKKYRIVFVLLVIIFALNIQTIYAADHRLESINMEVYINEDGSARIKEERRANLIEGTENYIVMKDLGKSQVIDFQVYENGQKFQYVDNWDINESREYKTNKNGIIKTSDGYELSWGIGEYGAHEYILEYTITNFIKQLEDSQVIIWEFITYGTNTPPEEVTITISSDNEFSSENEKIWGFGFDGDIIFEDGKIVATSNRPLTSSEYVTILTKLPDGMFQTQDVLDKTFEEIQEIAFEGSDYDNNSYEEGVSPGGGNYNQKSPSRSIPFIGTIITVLIGFMTFGIAKMATLFEKSPSQFKRRFKEEYYRDYPYEGNFLDIYYIPYMMGIANFENILTGFILKWINEDRISTSEVTRGRIFKKESTNINFLNKSALDNNLENELFQMMLSAAGKNEILEENEFTKWAGKNSNKIESWEKRVKEYSTEKLQDLGYVNVFEKRFLFISTPGYELTEKGKDLETKIYKYINYLYDFSLLNEHEAINVKIWDNIMIWAGFLGLTEVVSKQFAKLYPNYQNETVYTGNTILLTHHLARNIASARVSTSSSSSGIGGGTSMGGGGGSFGGGGGGGTR